MTCRLDELNQHDVLYGAARAYPGGLEALAQRMAMSPSVLRSKLRRQIETHHVNFEQVSEIIELLEESGRGEAADNVIQSFLWRHGRVAVKLPDVATKAEDLFAQVLEVMREQGRLAEHLNEALAEDGRIDQRELAVIERDLQLVIEGLVALRQKVQSKFLQTEEV